MLFNSHEFLLVFLPATLLGFYLLGCRLSSSSDHLAHPVVPTLLWWWRPINILIIGPSIIINYLLASILLRLNQNEGSRSLSKSRLLLGIAFNVVFLGFFKYTDFLYGTINDVFGAKLILMHIILPLGISFHYLPEDRVPDRRAGRAGEGVLRFANIALSFCSFRSLSPARSSTIAK